ncbi:class I SAM-dependent methyltransferase [Glycomyces terrestris]|uniref:Class I SAM-dependent methyltransferase n=1 Tax=Glycomyces terrestris TaxID=2493553 RepID=A0A426UY71_9ACTN|nr:class I SAM-dependent methyltransferase [Glycomyces terrestris]RRR99513.1 class I SAM-dependent methyltransferase [Glycomyces terrestris]
MGPSDRMLLIELTERLKQLGEAVEGLRETQAGIERRLDAIEAAASADRKAAKLTARTVYAQVEDLMALYRLTGPGGPLPRMRGWAAGPELTRFLAEEAAARGGARVLECGSGTSTVVLALIARSIGSGQVIALEHDPHYAAQTRAELDSRGLGGWGRVIDAPLTDVDLGGETWRWYDPKLVPGNEIDMLLVDGPPGATGPQARYPALPLLAERLAEDALVVLDDADRPDERAIAARWAEAHPDFTARHLDHERGTLVLRRNTPQD